MNMQYEPRTAWRIALLLLAFMMANFVDKIVVGMLAVPIMNELKISPAQFGVIGSSFFWLFSFGGIAGGFLSNRVAARWLLLVMALSWAVCQIPLVFSTSVAVFVAARIALGLTEGPAYPVAIHAVYKWFPPGKRILPVSLIGAGAALGLLIAGVTVPLITLHWGWRANFLVLLVAGLTWSAVWLMFGREGTIDDTPATAVARAHVPYRRLLTDPTVLASMLMQFVSYWAIVLIFTWLPAYFQNGLGYDALTSGRLYALAIMFGIPVSLTVSLVVQRLIARGVPSRFARGWTAAACQVLGGTMFICLVIPGISLVVREVAVICVIAFGTFSYAMCPAILDEVTPFGQRGAMLAIGNSIASLAGVIAPILTGRLVEAGSASSGYEQGFVLCGALLVAGSAVGVAFINPARSLRRLGGESANDATGAMPAGGSTTR
ncbi:putative sulfoacetate transporter SauU [Paraburkholderia kirstenboschensis]|uniref:MFS transporter n=1 Tax=Paraburkholderia kirstenboschensis TaxID=1245436 RepID=UPI000AF382E8|nr:MFS transporter [Paraburkholderia kirstenboschensis]CAD6551079.1 putative sulfoacetate transporter SauU [Paraburkholderia kirstenboschensis]